MFAKWEPAKFVIKDTVGVEIVVSCVFRILFIFNCQLQATGACFTALMAPSKNNLTSGRIFVNDLRER